MDRKHLLRWKILPKWKMTLNADYVNRKAADSRLNQESGSMTDAHEVKMKMRLLTISMQGI